MLALGTFVGRNVGKLTNENTSFNAPILSILRRFIQLNGKMLAMLATHHYLKGRT